MTGPSSTQYNGTSGPLPATYNGGRIDPYLTNIAIADFQADQDFLTPTVFPVLPVAMQGGRYSVWERGSLLRPEMRRKPYGDRPVQGSYKIGNDSFWCENSALEKVIDPADIANAMDPLQPFEGAVNYLTLNARLSMDKEWGERYFQPGVWAYQYVGKASNPNAALDTPEFLQFDQAGAMPAQFVRSRGARMGLMTGRKPNVLIVGENVFQYLTFSPDFVDRVKYVQQGIADLALMASFFDVDKVVVARGVYNAAAEGLADDFKYLVDANSMLLVYAAPRPSKDLPSAGYTFNWRGLFNQMKGAQTDAQNTAALAIIRRGYDDRAPADWIQIHTAYEMKITASDLGMYFSDVIGENLLDR
ncbi:hypothetical protein [Deinococcus sp.]|uniref:hypothetical protein n=1 Tax=Deinococcus sp. TaxID=47478 RepID=UPI0025DFEF1B|nr:hypothetical protein [Deinococcus sp.]